MAEQIYSLGEETEQIEFKKSTGELKEAVISMAAILNKHQSGKLYFGVATICDQRFIRTLRKNIMETGQLF